LDKFSNGINETNARDLVHKNVIRILDIIVSEKYALVVMEYYKNSRNLQCVLDDLSFVFNKQTTINFSRDIACGLKYCHENGVLHLDIKPKNLLVCNNICKICDFGNSVKELVGTQTFKYHVRIFVFCFNKTSKCGSDLVIFVLLGNRGVYCSRNSKRERTVCQERYIFLGNINLADDVPKMSLRVTR
jgi:serine/threonine protein kinase